MTTIEQELVSLRAALASAIELIDHPPAGSKQTDPYVRYWSDARVGGLANKLGELQSSIEHVRKLLADG